MTLVFIITSLLAIILQSSSLIKLFTFPVLNGIRPDFILIMIIWTALRDKRPHASEAIAFATGFVEDMLSGGLIGLNAFTLTVIAFLINQTKAVISMDKYPALAGFVAVVSLVEAIIYLLFQTIFVGNIHFFQVLFPQGLVISLYNGILAALIFAGLDRLITVLPHQKK